MPSKNTIREYDVDAYYHVYNRGAGGAAVFKDAQDKYKFISLLERYLTDDDAHAVYPTYELELLAYCVMGNHFHLLLYHHDEPRAMTDLMHSVTTAYSMYYNKKYKSRGHVFQGVFRASRITNEAYLQHISRYIHLNPKTYLTYKWSSLPYYLEKLAAPDWLHPERLLDTAPDKYLEFLESYEKRGELLEDIREQLAL